MKYCKKCGNQLSDNAKFCPGCGYQYVEKTKTTGTKTDNSKKLISDIVSVISICLGGIAVILSFLRTVFIWLGIVGVIISVIGIVLSRKMNGRTDIMPIIGLILSIASVCIVPIAACTSGLEIGYSFYAENLAI